MAEWQLTKDEWETFINAQEEKHNRIFDTLANIVDTLERMENTIDSIESTTDNIEANTTEDEPEDE